MRLRAWIALIVLSSNLLLAGCAGRWGAASLPFPEDMPALHTRGVLIDGERAFCMPVPEALALSKWLDKLEAFRHAYERQH
jgi:hypothetical protein